MFLARQPDYKPSSSSGGAAAAQGGKEGSSWSFPGRRPPSKCWARELAVMESWHCLLAERDITVGNSQGREWSEMSGMSEMSKPLTTNHKTQKTYNTLSWYRCWCWCRCRCRQMVRVRVPLHARASFCCRGRALDDAPRLSSPLL